MKYLIILAASAAALTLTGCNKEKTPDSPTPAADAATAVASPARSRGEAFADMAAASDMFETESSRLAASKAASSDVKQFAEQMIKAQSESTAKLATAAAAATPAITPLGDMTDMQRQTLSDLAGKSGADFDTAYARAQVDAHQATLDALKAYSVNGDVASLKTFATQMAPVVTAHLNMAKAL